MEKTNFYPDRNVIDEMEISALIGIHMQTALDAHFRQVELDVERVAAQINQILFFGIFEQPPAPPPVERRTPRVATRTLSRRAARA